MTGTSAFGQWLKQRRAVRHLSQKGLAYYAHCSPSLIRKLESGERRPSLPIAEQLADALQIADDQRAMFINLALFNDPQTLQLVLHPPSAHTTPGFLPTAPTSLLGRKREITMVSTRLLESTGRLLTLVGPPGVGKTRLAIAAAAALRVEFPDGTWCIELAPVRDAMRVGATVTRALELKEPADGDHIGVLKGFLRARRALLLFDNFEHMLPAAPLVAALLAACPGLFVLVTSRVPLHIRAEQRFPVHPLALPAHADRVTVADAPATALFVERVTAMAPDFTLDDANAAVVAAICAQLDGLPLVIELAAARTDTLALDVLLTQLVQRLVVLTDGPRDLHPHQQTLYATIAWSYDLLSATEQRSFARLGVFAGGCTPEAAAAVGAQHLKQLRTKQLIQEQYDGHRTRRYVLLETLREFAVTQLAQRGEYDAVQQRHATYFAMQATQAEHQIAGVTAPRWLGALDADLANLRAAMQWSLNHDGGATTAQIATALFTYWRARGLFGEGGNWIATALACADDGAIRPHSRARALFVAGFLRSQQGNSDTIALLERSLALYRALDDQEGIASVLNALGMVARYPGNYDNALILLHESLALQPIHGTEYVRSNTLNQIGMALLERGDYAEATRYFTEEIALKQMLGAQRGVWIAQVYLAETYWRHDAWAQAQAIYEAVFPPVQAANDRELIAHILRGLGIVATHAGDLAQAQTYSDESLRIYREMSLTYGVATVLPHLAQLALLRDDRAMAARHCTEGVAIASALFALMHIPACLAVQAVLAVPAQPEHAARVLGVAAALEKRFALQPTTLTTHVMERARRATRAQLGAAIFTRWYDQATASLQMHLPTVQFPHAYAAIAAIDIAHIIALAVAG